MSRINKSKEEKVETVHAHAGHEHNEKAVEEPVVDESEAAIGDDVEGEGAGDGEIEDTTEEAKADDDSKTKIKPDTSKWANTDGKKHTDDFVGHALAGLTLEQVKDVAGKLGFEPNKYDHLNVGQQRMNLGNRLRAVVKDTGKEGSGHEAAKAAITKHSDHHKAANAAAKPAKPAKPAQVDVAEEAA